MIYTTLIIMYKVFILLLILFSCSNNISITDEKIITGDWIHCDRIEEHVSAWDSASQSLIDMGSHTIEKTHRLIVTNDSMEYSYEYEKDNQLILFNKQKGVLNKLDNNTYNYTKQYVNIDNTDEYNSELSNQMTAQYDLVLTNSSTLKLFNNRTGISLEFVSVSILETTHYPLSLFNNGEILD